jgi:PKD repeat protein
MERKYEIFLGTGVLIAGIVILLFVFSMMLPIAKNPGKFLDEQSPTTEQAQPPECAFDWSSNDMSVSFTDASNPGSASITSYSWEFGDGSTGSQKNPTHTYGNPQEYNVRLTVQDGDGMSASATATVYPEGQNSGSSQSDSSLDGKGFSLDFTPFAMSIVFMGAYLILYLVGASILKAGWNLISPRAEKITLRVKPKHIEVEPVGPPAQPQVAYVQQPPQQPVQQYQPQQQPPPPPPQYPPQ